MNNSNGRINNINKSNGQTSKSIIRIVIILLIVFILCYFSYQIIRDFQNSEADAPYLVEYITNGTKSKIVKGNKIKKSQDGQFGTEFTYSVWLLIKDDNFSLSSSGKCNQNNKHIFHKGSNENMSSDSKPLLQSPGVWLDNKTNRLQIMMNTYYSPYERCDIGNVPINKWFNLTIMLIGNSLDVYVNCNLKKRCRLSGVPKINYDDLWICQKGGFNGYISRLRYFNYAIEPFKVTEICKMGPGTYSPEPQDDIPPYLADNYWTTTGFPVARGFPEN